MMGAGVGIGAATMSRFSGVDSRGYLVLIGLVVKSWGRDQALSACWHYWLGRPWRVYDHGVDGIGL